MILKVSRTVSTSSVCSTEEGIAASVKMKDNIVAMSGAIIPEPLATPLIVTGTPSIIAVAVAALGNVSVVMMARAAEVEARPRAHLSIIRSKWARQRLGPKRLADHAGRGLKDIAPPAAQRSQSAAPIAFTVVAPALPVKAFELPALTMSARADGLFLAFQIGAAPIDRRRCHGRAREYAGELVVPGSNSASNRSSRPLYFWPDAIVAMRHAGDRRHLGKPLGASGERG